MFPVGVDGLEEVLGSALKAGTTLLIEGDPGAGKTVLAATICYANAIRERPCLYVSLRERWEVFREEMLGLGMDFEELSDLRLFKYARLPVIINASMLSTVTKVITDYVAKIKPRVVVIDDIKLMVSTHRFSMHKVRSVIQNFLYDLSSVIKGVTILVASWGGDDRAVAKEFEHAVDVVLELHVSADEGMLNRSIIVKKVRGSRVPSWGLPFRIVNGYGIKVLSIPVNIEKVSPPSSDVIHMPCRVLSDTAGNLHKGCLMLVSYPPDGRCHECVYLPVALMIALSRLKVAVVSFRISSSEIKYATAQALKRVRLDERLANELVVHAVGVNPALLGLDDVLGICDDVLRNHCPDILVLHGTEILDFLYGGSGKLASTLYNLAMRARLRGSSLVILYGKNHGSTYEALSALSSIVLRLEYVREGNKIHPQLYVWGSGKTASVLSIDEVRQCIDEGMKVLSTVKERVRLGESLLKWGKKGRGVNV